MVRSRYKFLQLFVSVFFGIVFILLPFLLVHATDNKPKNTYLLPLLPILGIFFLYSFFQKNPRIIFDDQFITVKTIFTGSVYAWSDVVDIFISKKEPYFGQYYEAIVIHFMNEKKLIIFDIMYSNTAELRTMITKIAGNKEADPMPTVSPMNLTAVNRRRYAGNVYTSLNTIIILFFFILFLVVMKDNRTRNPSLVIFAVLIALIYLFIGTQMNFFLIDDGYIVIRNHYFPWRLKKISLADIDRIDIETPYRRSTGLRILTKAMRSKFYGAGSLRNINWQNLLDDLKLIGIPTRDDR